MNIQRQYNLPNCTLVLEGLTNNTPTDNSESRAVLSILVNTECRFLGISQKLQGGSSLLKNLVKTVSEYAQG